MTSGRVAARKPRAFLGTLMALLTLFVVAARDSAGDVLSRSWRDRAGACALALEQYDGTYYQLRVSAVEAAHLEDCQPTFAELAASLGRMLAAAAPDGAISLFVGTVGDIPGLSAELVATARSSGGWDEPRGRPRAGDPNGFVAGLLLKRLVLRDLLPGYEIVGVSVGKVSCRHAGRSASAAPATGCRTAGSPTTPNSGCGCGRCRASA